VHLGTIPGTRLPEEELTRRQNAHRLWNDTQDACDQHHKLLEDCKAGIQKPSVKDYRLDYRTTDFIG
jgi:hypothetical protein